MSSRGIVLGAAGMLAGSLVLVLPSIRRGAEPGPVRFELPQDLKDAPSAVRPAPPSAALTGRMLFAEELSTLPEEPAESSSEASPAAAPRVPFRREDPWIPGEPPPLAETDPYRKTFDGAPRSAAPTRGAAAPSAPSAGGTLLFASAHAVPARIAGVNFTASAQPARGPFPRRAFPAARRTVPASAPASAQSAATETPAAALVGQSLAWTQTVDAGEGAIGGPNPGLDGGGTPVFDGMRVAGSAAPTRGSAQAPPSSAPSAAGAKDVSKGATGGFAGGFRQPSRSSGKPLGGPDPGLGGVTPLAATGEETPASHASSMLENVVDFTRAQAKAQDFPGWSRGDRLSACGLIAAEALQRVLERDPTLDRIDEIRQTAVNRRLWDTNVGMYGLEAERTLVKALGMDVVKVSLWLNSRADFDELRETIAHALANGRPVIISTTRHYFFAQGYADGKFFVGHTGEIMSAYGGRPSMSLESIAHAGATITGILVPQ